MFYTYIIFMLFKLCYFNTKKCYTEKIILLKDIKFLLDTDQKNNFVKLSK